MKIKEIMSPVSIYHEPGTSLGELVRTMAENRHSCGLVCEADRPVGIVTERDIVRLIAASGNAADWFRQRISEVVVRRPICVPTEADLEAALDLARSYSIRHLPVVDALSEKLVGIVTFSDMLNAYTTLLARTQSRIPDDNQARGQAMEDPLTGLPNRRAMKIDLRHASAIAQRRSEPYSIALMELDYFKEYRSKYGDEDANQMVKKVASQLDCHARDSDKLFRVSRHQFLLLMPYTPLEGAMIGARRIGKMIYDCGIPHAGSSKEAVSMSIGVAACQPAEPWEVVMERADDAMHDAMAFDGNAVRLREAPTDSDYWEIGSPGEARRPNPG